MVAFLQIVCFAGIYMKLGDLMSMFSLNAGDSQQMGRRIFRRPYLYMRHRARRFERRVAGAVTAGGIAGAVAGNAVSNGKQKSHTQSRSNTSSSMGQKAGSAVGAVLDTKNKVKDKANAVRENIKDVPTRPLMPFIPQRKRRSQVYRILSVAWCRNKTSVKLGVMRNSNSIDRISLISVWNYRKLKKRSLEEKRTDRRQRELPVHMKDPLLLLLQKLRNRRKSNALLLL